MGQGCLVIIGGLFVMALLLALPAWLFMLGWNFAIAPVFGITALGFWQSFVLLFVLSWIGRLLFKNNVSKSK